MVALLLESYLYIVSRTEFDESMPETFSKAFTMLIIIFIIESGVHAFKVAIVLRIKPRKISALKSFEQSMLMIKMFQDHSGIRALSAIFGI
jgi:hypothetical protein